MTTIFMSEKFQLHAHLLKYWCSAAGRLLLSKPQSKQFSKAESSENIYMQHCKKKLKINACIL